MWIHEPRHHPGLGQVHRLVDLPPGALRSFADPGDGAVLDQEGGGTLPGRVTGQDVGRRDQRASHRRAAAYTSAMPRPRALSEAALRRARLAAQLLHRPRRMAPVDVVRHLLGVQAQVLPAAAMALACRTDGLDAGSVERARGAERSIVLAWMMRGTLHLVAAEDYGWLLGLTAWMLYLDARLTIVFT